jgi:hypothetical protein
MQSFSTYVTTDLGLTAVVGRATARAAGSAVCAGAAVVQQFHVEEQQCGVMSVGPDFVEWDSWYAGLASLVE